MNFLKAKNNIMKKENKDDFNPRSFLTLTHTEMRQLAGDELTSPNLPDFLYLEKRWWVENTTILTWHELLSKFELLLMESLN